MLTPAFASRAATRASAPGLLRMRRTKAVSSVVRYLARRSTRLAWPGLLTTKWIFPRPALVSALSAEMLTRASANVRASAARTPGRDFRLRVSWAALATGAPPPRRLGSDLDHSASRIKLVRIQSPDPRAR